MEFLDRQGLDALIKKIQNGSISSKKYENVRTSAYEENFQSSVFFLKMTPKDLNTPWILKYRITAEIKDRPDSRKMAEITLGGNDNHLDYYNVQNSVHQSYISSADSHVMLQDSWEGGRPAYIGLDFGIFAQELHNVQIDILYIYNCTVSYIPYTTFPSFESVILSQFSFKKSGIFDSNIILTKDDFSIVADTGSYNDLINKPTLLQGDIDEENELISFTLVN